MTGRVGLIKVLAIIAVFCWTSNAHAAENLGLAFVNAFKAECVTGLPSEKVVQARAVERKYKGLPDDMINILQPTTPNTPWQGWMVDTGPAPVYFLTTSHGTANGQVVETCGITNPNAPEQEVIPALVKEFSLNAPDTDKTPTAKHTRARSWDIVVSGKQAILFAFTSDEMSKEPGVVLNILKFVD